VSPLWYLYRSKTVTVLEQKAQTNNGQLSDFTSFPTLEEGETNTKLFFAGFIAAAVWRAVEICSNLSMWWSARQPHG
jgi:hypothetical protein